MTVSKPLWERWESVAVNGRGERVCDKGLEGTFFTGLLLSLQQFSKRAVSSFSLSPSQDLSIFRVPNTCVSPLPRAYVFSLVTLSGLCYGKSDTKLVFMEPKNRKQYTFCHQTSLLLISRTCGIFLSNTSLVIASPAKVLSKNILKCSIHYLFLVDVFICSLGTLFYFFHNYIFI